MNGEVGYKKPPKGRQWQKGESGNPNGRPKHQLTPIQRYVLKALNTLITVGDEKREVITAREAIVRLRMLAATKGDPNALRDLMLLEKRELPPTARGADILIVEYVASESDIETHAQREIDDGQKKKRLRRSGQGRL